MSWHGGLQRLPMTRCSRSSFLPQHFLLPPEQEDGRRFNFPSTCSSRSHITKPYKPWPTLLLFVHTLMQIGFPQLEEHHRKTSILAFFGLLVHKGMTRTALGILGTHNRQWIKTYKGNGHPSKTLHPVRWFRIPRSFIHSFQSHH